MRRDKFYFISLNFIKDKHKDLIEWIKSQADEQESSISSFCINLMKKEYRRYLDDKMEQRENNRTNTKT